MNYKTSLHLATALIISCFLFSGRNCANAQTAAGKGEIVINVTNIRNSKGNIKAALFKGQDGYESKKVCSCCQNQGGNKKTVKLS